MADRNIKKVRTGVVTSDKMEKSCTVLISRQFAHKLYKKQVRKSKKFMAHDEKNDARIGDKVRIMECRPLSRSKRWRLVEIIERAK